MKNNKKKYVIPILICSAIAIFFSSGLRQQQPIEQLNIISAIGQDIDIKSDIVNYTTLFSVYLFGPQEKIESDVIKSTAANLGQTRQVRQLIDDKESILGSEKLVVESEEAAVFGIRNMIDILFRNPYLNDTAYMVVSKDKAADILNMNIKGYPSSGDFIAGLIKNSKYYNFFSDNYKIIDVFFAVDSEGRNITLPYIEIVDKGIEITGMALFKKDKMITKINTDELKTFNIIKENNVRGILTIQKNAKDYINYYATSKRKISCTKKGDKYNFTINIDLDGDIIENTLYKNLRSSSEKNDEFNRDMAQKVKKECDSFITKMRSQYKIDCLDLGQVAAAKNGRQTGVDWNSIVCDSKIEVNVKVKIDKTGRGDY
ncbi:Ger(x)C family spore germination protein [Clostridium bowmanii]|uniref:Ger(x)C family spore germination protein n=1 Tax=Clostridium bowmanii TaxID=132925 RepID=UPI001C0DF4AF|nr:Ger(x)C family spore germination protein [Clostridium bowmanii]MBU3190208.1 Ger(x)C family spore germination protein [Clostridium bowmanii]MCA1074817.1 Ger(x)C family spore germination protein [Clostridium bowmanii]